MGKQTVGKYGDGKGGSCALGALILGTGFMGPKQFQEDILGDALSYMRLRFPDLHMSAIACPGCARFNTLEVAILCLNDTHGWTRERIAGWIEAHVEVPTYSMLQMQGYMADPELPVAALAGVKHV